MSKVNKRKGIVLRRQPFFEKDCLVELFSEEFGKCKLLVKYAQKKPIMGQLEPTNYIDCVTYKGKSFLLLQQCSLSQMFPEIRSNFNRMSLAGYLLNLIRLSTSYDQPNPNLFQLLLDALNHLNAPKVSLQDVKSEFEMSFLKCEGLFSASSNRPPNFISAFEDYTGSKAPSLTLI